MSKFIALLMSWWSINVVLEAFMWGLAGYVIFRSLKMHENKWLIGALCTFFIFLLWEVFLTNSILDKAGISFQNKEIIEFLGSNTETLFKTGISDILLALIQILFGFKIAQFLVRKYIS